MRVSYSRVKRTFELSPINEGKDMIGPTRFRPYDLNQLSLLPPDMKDWLPDGHLAYFIIDVVGEFDLSGIYASYDSTQGGQPPYDPRMMVNLILYAYCVGIPSSRKIEQATYDSVPFRVLSADQHPDHDTIAEFRRRHLKSLADLFAHVFRLCERAGLVKLGHVSLDGIKVKANASKHKAMSYGRMEKKACELEAEVDRLLALAEKVDDTEDTRYGKGSRGDELPEELRHKQSRLRKIRTAMKTLEEEALAKYPAKQAEYETQKEARKKRGGRGRPPKTPSKKPDTGRQYNFTDPDSRILPVEGGKTFLQGYNCQIAVDDKAQIIVAVNVIQDPSDRSPQSWSRSKPIPAERNPGHSPRILDTSARSTSRPSKRNKSTPISPPISTNTAKGRHPVRVDGFQIRLRSKNAWPASSGRSKADASTQNANISPNPYSVRSNRSADFAGSASGALTKFRLNGASCA